MILKKCALCLSVLILGVFYHHAAKAINHASKAASNSGNETDQYIAEVYSSIDFGKGQKLNPEVFNKAMRGYLNLQAAGKLSDHKELLTIADFTQSSTRPRLWVIDLKAHKLRFNTYVAHGQGSGDDFATTFSNSEGTHASSIGFYVTADTYNGEHGNSLRLIGVDNGFNDAAFDRGIVMHAANYVSKDLIDQQGRLGRSWGCPAIAPELAQPIINLIKDGTCLFIYYPQPQYLKTAYWMNKRVENLPGMDDHIKLQLAEPKLENEHIAVAPKRDTVIIFMHQADHM